MGGERYPTRISARSLQDWPHQFVLQSVWRGWFPTDIWRCEWFDLIDLKTCHSEIASVSIIWTLTFSCTVRPNFDGFSSKRYVFQDSDVACPTCVKSTRSTIQDVFIFDDDEVQPSCLFVRIPLFDQVVVRGQAEVRVENRARKLNIDDFDCNNIEFPQFAAFTSASWRVSAVICHSAESVNAGHYWAWRRLHGSASGRTFIKMDDERIVQPPVEYENFSSLPNAYVLMLERN